MPRLAITERCVQRGELNAVHVNRGNLVTTAAAELTLTLPATSTCSAATECRHTPPRVPATSLGIAAASTAGDRTNHRSKPSVAQ
jgi:hypothetical protein